ncbi:fructosamine kinase family protein [Pseudonocardia lacus]|uniref:fructosamine kinase family protein n=1 Tax=Pseudonocardia lacus TaxID=2835865 RepID=UPI0027E26871|nr:fructosamine kinase family protein [Pseudonocardia lacus]
MSGVARTRWHGRAAVVKRGPASAVAAEAAGLRWLRVPDGPPVPEVLDERPGELVTAFVPPGDASREAAAALGRGLAVLHRAGAPAFGAPPPGGPADAWIGAAPMRNSPAPHWPAWYAADRLLPYLRTARDAGSLTPDGVAAVERVLDRIDELAGPPESPARLHGDLWSGNVLWSTDGAWIIDPAAHGGHRETDLAMLALFGCPAGASSQRQVRVAAPAVSSQRAGGLRPPTQGCGMDEKEHLRRPQRPCEDAPTPPRTEREARRLPQAPPA